MDAKDKAKGYKISIEMTKPEIRMTNKAVNSRQMKVPRMKVKGKGRFKRPKL